MEHVLIVSGSQSAAASLSGFMRNSFRCTPRVSESAYQARTALENDRDTELVIINAPLVDENGIDLARFISQKTFASCLLVTRQEKADQLADMADREQVIVLGRPLNQALLYQLVRTIEITLRRSQRIAEENLRLEQKIKDIRTVDRAKFLLMQYQSMTEAEAHAYLEKYAMDKRKRKPAAALEIIDRINEQYL